MSYQKFKYDVIKRAGWKCEVVGCDAVPDGIHHLVKVSRFRKLREDVRVGLATCGPCHSEIERREREGLDADEMVPPRRIVEAEAALLEVYGEGARR